MISESADDGLRCEQFRQIAEIGGDVAWILAYPGRELSYVSTTAVTLLGHERAALVRELQGGGALAPLLAGLDERVRRFIGGDDSRRQLTRHLDWTRADGEKIALEVVSALVVDGTGKPTSVVGVVRDLSGRRLHEEQQKRFVSMLSHEFRTPLSTIDGAIQRLEATAHGADDATRQRYRKIQTAVDRLIAMLDHYLSPDRMAQIGRAPLKTGLSPVALLETGAAQARAAGRVVTVEVDGLPERLRCDPQALHLALEVLIDNALKYTPESTAITLGGRMAPEGGVELTVTDGGEGIAEDELGRIFDRFFRGRNARGQRGSGLGLYMARAVIEVHGGILSAQNADHGGARLRIWLPARHSVGKYVASEPDTSDNSSR